MAHDNSYQRDSLFEASPGSRDSPYNEPTEVALRRFLYWIASTDTEDDGRYPTVSGAASAFDRTNFLKWKRTATCLYDLAYVWLVEGDAVDCCPTYESWLLFLIAFADATRYFRDLSAYGAELSLMEDQPYFGGVANKARLRELDILYRNPAFRRGGWDDEDRQNSNAGVDHYVTGSTYQHPALRRDIYDDAAALYARRVMYDSRTR